MRGEQEWRGEFAKAAFFFIVGTEFPPFRAESHMS